MVTDKEMFETLRALINRGTDVPERIAKRANLSEYVVYEALQQALKKFYVIEYLIPAECYLLTSSGELMVRNDSLKRLAAFQNEYDPDETQWEGD